MNLKESVIASSHIILPQFLNKQTVLSSSSLPKYSKIKNSLGEMNHDVILNN